MSTPTLLLPQISIADDLPISAWRDRIAEAITHHQVIIVAGETGSGKTTQLPKICLQLGRKAIGHTQPRRIAARSVAERIAEELKTEVGQLVGYQVRFTRKASAQSRIKVMTDGVLLAEIGRDRELRRYDTIIIDEAHERSLNIDFLLGYLKQLLRRRPELKVIVTSATIDTARFSEHFDNAPIIEVSGRSYPVEIRYRPLQGEPDPDDRDLPDGSTSQPHPVPDSDRDPLDAISDAVLELRAVGDGDILVFLSGERDIRDTADALTALNLRACEVLPLYSRLSAAEQHRVFQTHPGMRVVLATNVAETSLTVPGIRYVVDAGTARISRYSARTKVQRLPIEAISQASANQRAGRCGRVAPGVCIRLYSEADFESRPVFTEPEILRTNLASVILQMTAAGLGDIAAFPFVEPPDSAQISDGLRLLDELGALSSKGKEGVSKGDRSHPQLTPIGRQLARIPLDPRMGRMLLAGEKYGCLKEMLIIVAGMSIQDPRERPAEKQQQADELHRRFWAPMNDDRGPEQLAGVRGVPKAELSRGDGKQPADGSDFVALLRLWDYLRDQQKDLSGNAFRRMCRDEFLHFLRVREWQDLHAQLRGISRELKLDHRAGPAASEQIHTAILTGLLSHVGLSDLKDEKRLKDRSRSAQPRRRGRGGPQEYLGSRGSRFAINPGSSVARSSPPLVMAGELVETSRLWARMVAGIEAGWVEEVGDHLLKRHYSEPHWSGRAAAVVAYERVTLYGVPIVSGRPVNYAHIDPTEAREIFIRSALVEGDWRTRHHFLQHNADLRSRAEELEERTRRRDIVVGDQVIFDFYDARIPPDVVSGAHFDSWWKTERHRQPGLLDLSLADLMAADSAAVDADAFPDAWWVGDQQFKVGYTFDPGSGRDGVSVEIPVDVLNQVDPAPFSWQVPGLRQELAAEFIRSLPKAIRRNFVPAPEFARKALAWLFDDRAEPLSGGPAAQTSESLPQALGRALRSLTGIVVEPTQWEATPLPDHLRVTFVVVEAGASRAVLAEGKDLAKLREGLAPQLSSTLNLAAAEVTRSGATEWVFGTIPARLDLQRQGRHIVGYPALVDEQTSVGLAVYDTAASQRASQRTGLRRLVLLNTPDPTKWTFSHLGNADKLALGTGPYGSVPALLSDARLASVGAGVATSGSAPEDIRDPAAFARLCDAVRQHNADRMRSMVQTAAQVLRLHQSIRVTLTGLSATSAAGPAREAVEDIAEQLGNLVFAGFIAVTGEPHFGQLVRYLRAIEIRLEDLRTTPGRDRAGLDTILAVEESYAALCAAAPPGPLPTEIEDIGWQLEELRVSLFAQTLGTSRPVSDRRVLKAIASARQQLERR